jgi:hypothetical protein
LHKEGDSKATKKQSILLLVAHEFAHFWFGNLVASKMVELLMAQWGICYIISELVMANKFWIYVKLMKLDYILCNRSCFVCSWQNYFHSPHTRSMFSCLAVSFMRMNDTVISGRKCLDYTRTVYCRCIPASAFWIFCQLVSSPNLWCPYSWTNWLYFWYNFRL